MNRYALEMYAHEKQQNYASMSAILPLLGFLSRNRARAGDYEAVPPPNDSMTFIYGLRGALVEIDFDDVLPMIK